MSSESSIQRLGSCLCRQIRFTVLGKPYSCAVCHCINCKKSGGSAFSTSAFFTPDKIILTAGQELLRKYDDTDTTSGNTLTRLFCANCGSPLFMSSPAKTEEIAVSLDAVENHAWVPHRETRPDARCPWVTIHQDGA
ncbi:Mss4-like protein [Mycena albidolilacea]|uniref:Mss4-like protein n=1 Tax=Mycena albidolilacea TaxID=1033008 RepID=A0AAD6YX49_9AGAR|nr:Mss4-like protein [Mycena albidolilacea]